MSARPTFTIVLITRSVVARADVARRGEVVGLWSQPRPDVQEWPFLIESALTLGPRRAGRVFVLCSDLWTQTLTLGRASLGMNADELASALNFEAETMSGLSALDAVAGVQVLPTGEGYWIVQSRRLDLDQADEIIRSSGGRLAGIGHPGGVPNGLGVNSDAWSRVEFWPDAVLFLRGRQGGSTMVSVSNADPSMGRWKGDWQSWRAHQGQNEADLALVAPAMMVPKFEADTIVLDDEPSLRDWFEAWAVALAKSKPAVPLVRPAIRPMSAGKRTAIAMALAAFVLLACISHQLWLGRWAEMARAETKLALQPKAMFDAGVKNVSETEARRSKLTEEADKLEQTIRVVETQRRRLSRLFDKLGDHGIADLFVKGIDNDHGEPSVKGVCLEASAADQLAEALARHLRADGWDVQSAKKQALQLTDDGGPFNFEIVLRSSPAMRVELEKKK